MTPITFPEQRHWLSNASPAQVWLDGVPYPNVDVAYQASKTDDLDTRLWIRAAATMREVWWRGRTVKLPDMWELMRGDIMRKLLSQKFTHDETRCERLCATGDTMLVYAPRRVTDCFWGTWDGVGQNILGMLLMELRWNLQRDKAWKAWRETVDPVTAEQAPRRTSPSRRVRDPLAS